MSQESFARVRWFDLETAPIVYFEEVERISLESTRKHWNEIEALVVEQLSFKLLVDVTTTRVPNGEVRHAICGRLQALLPELEHVAMWVGSNVFARAASHFIFGDRGIPYSVHKTREHALYRLLCD